MGNVIWENDIVGNVGQFGDDLDFQVNVASARSFDLTNRIKTGVTTSQKVVDTKTRFYTLNETACKYGKTTGYTCGRVTNINYTPNHPDYGTSNNYVRVDRLAGSTTNIGCGGDSGSPVFKFVVDGVDALGILSSSNGGDCSGNTGSLFTYSPIDYINWSPYRILTNHYPQYLYQHQFWSATNCEEFKTPVDGNGQPIWAQTTSQPCRTFAPGSGTIETYTAIVTSGFLREALWRGGKGYVRDIPLKSNGEVDWNAASTIPWTHCCTASAPSAQGAFVVGNHVYQNQFWSATNCTEYKTPLANDGQPNWGQTTSQPCRTFAPGSGSIGSYTAVVTAEYLREAIWRGGKGCVRDMPLNSSNTDVDWNAPVGWTHCCTASSPGAQGAYVLTHP